MIILKPKRRVILVLFCSFLIGLVVPFLIYEQVSSGESFFELRMRSRIGIFIPTFFLFAAIRVLVVLKTIEIDEDNNWTVNYFFPKRKRIFSMEDIEFIRRTDMVSYKFRIPITSYKIQLKNSKRIQFSSNELTDFERAHRVLKRGKYRHLYK